MFWFFDHVACGIMVPQPGIEPIPPALEGKVLTTESPGKSHLVGLHTVLSHCVSRWTTEIQISGLTVPK